MSYNPNFYSNFCGNNFTFQRPPIHNLVPPPPPPPPYFVPPTPVRTLESSDKEFVKHLEQQVQIKSTTKVRNKTISISELRQQLRNTLMALNELKSKEKMLAENIDKLSQEEWNSMMKKINENKIVIDTTLSRVNGPCLDVLQKLLTKRSAKRLRLKRARIEKKKEKENRIKELQERSRKIDENLQKIKNEITKARQEEEAKIQADIVLKEVLRKKQDAKKCIIKLDALVKLRKARQNTAKGRGENVSENDAVAFNTNIEKLKSLWVQRQAVYEKEEAKLRVKLKEDREDMKASVNETVREVRSNLDEWRDRLFGGRLPQVDFGGDLGRFIGVRSQWDSYISSEGSPLPVGWVLPAKQW